MMTRTLVGVIQTLIIGFILNLPIDSLVLHDNQSSNSIVSYVHSLNNIPRNENAQIRFEINAEEEAQDFWTRFLLDDFHSISSMITLPPTSEPTKLPTLVPSVEISTYIPTSDPTENAQLTSPTAQPSTSQCVIDASIECIATNSLSKCTALEYPRGACKSQITRLQFQYIPAACSGNLNNQTFTCTDLAPIYNSSSVLIKCKDIFQEQQLRTKPTVAILQEDIVTVRGVTPNVTIPEAIECSLSDAESSTGILQVVTIKRSSQLKLNQQIGSLRIVSCDDLNCFVDIEYKYNVVNIGSNVAKLTSVVSTTNNKDSDELINRVRPKRLEPEQSVQTKEYDTVNTCLPEVYATDLLVKANERKNSLSCQATSNNVFEIIPDCQLEVELQCQVWNDPNKSKCSDIQSENQLQCMCSSNCVSNFLFKYTGQPCGSNDQSIDSSILTYCEDLNGGPIPIATITFIAGNQVLYDGMVSTNMMFEVNNEAIDSGVSSCISDSDLSVQVSYPGTGEALQSIQFRPSCSQEGNDEGRLMLLGSLGSIDFVGYSCQNEDDPKEQDTHNCFIDVEYDLTVQNDGKVPLDLNGVTLTVNGEESDVLQEEKVGNVTLNENQSRVFQHLSTIERCNGAITSFVTSKVTGQTIGSGVVCEDSASLIFQLTPLPTSSPSAIPSDLPSMVPSLVPSRTPSNNPSSPPSNSPTELPSDQPSINPSYQPSTYPSAYPSPSPTELPSDQPSLTPSYQPTPSPTIAPTTEPTKEPSDQPSLTPSYQPTPSPTSAPTTEPTKEPSDQPSLTPSYQPTPSPTSAPTTEPTKEPSDQPSLTPSYQPTPSPTTAPTTEPTKKPSDQPSLTPSYQPTPSPTTAPTTEPTKKPSPRPSSNPSDSPSSQPIVLPTFLPSQVPSDYPSLSPFFGFCSLDVNVTCRIANGRNAGMPCGSQMAGDLCLQRPTEAALLFNGGDCSQSDNLQPQTFLCDDYNGGPPTKEGESSYIVVTDVRGLNIIYFSGFVAVGQTYRLYDNGNAFESDQNISIYNSDTTTPEHLLQNVIYHTSCAINLELNNKFGASQLVGYSNSVQGNVTAFVPAVLIIKTQVSKDGDATKFKSLKVNTNFAGDLDLSNEVANKTVQPGIDLIVTYPFTLDLSRRKTFTSTTTVTGSSVPGGSNCVGEAQGSFVAGRPSSGRIPTAVPTANPSFSPGPSPDPLITACEISTDVFCSTRRGTENLNCANLKAPTESKCTGNEPPLELNFIYNGLPCNASNTTTVGFRCATVNDGFDLGPPKSVFLTIQDGEQRITYFNDIVDLGDLFIVTPRLGSRFDESLHFFISALSGTSPGQLLQELSFGISCNNVDDVSLLTQYGALQLTGFTSITQGRQNAFEVIYLTYTISNEGELNTIVKEANLDSNLFGNRDLITGPGVELRRGESFQPFEFRGSLNLYDATGQTFSNSITVKGTAVQNDIPCQDTSELNISVGI